MVLHVLPHDTIRLIKSTQVITTPASVVKELLENALDAGATAVTIRLENYGFSHLEVRDNGIGIQEEDVNFVAKPHFTSKITTFADLASLNTYGFRGEALSSLCAVAEVCITTKTRDGVMGHTYTLDHMGSISTTKPAATPDGTTVIVKNLFKNVPVRRQYYSSPKRRKEELKKVEDLVFSLSLAAPGVHLTLTHDKCNIIQKSSARSIQEALMTTFPTVYKDLVLRERRTEDVHVQVYLPGSGPCDNPNLSRTTPDRLFILVNKRPISHKSIEKLVKAHYSQRWEGSHGRYPLGVVTLTLPLDAVDVNLEPNKTKILLKDEEQILKALQEIMNELYGPLEQPSKPGGDEMSERSQQTNITCTYACITEDLHLPTKENVEDGINIKTSSGVQVVKEKKSNLKCYGIIRSTTCKHPTSISTSAGSPASQDSGENYEFCDGDLFHDPPQVRQTGRGQERNCSASEKAVTSDPCKLKDSCKEKRENLCYINNIMRTSTPRNETGGNISFVSESSIMPDAGFDLSSGNSGNTPKMFKENISGIVPLPPPQTNDMSKKDAVENSFSLEQNHQSILPESHLDKSQLHESFTGSDGIPVYKIPPLPTESSEMKIESEQNKNHNEGGSNDLRVTPQVAPPHFITSEEGLQHNSSHLEERENASTGAWCRGQPIGGKNIQTVQLLAGTTTAARRFSELKATKRSRPQVPSEANSASSTPPKKTKISSLGPSSFDYVHGKPVKKPSSPFILFSRDIRSQVLSENPGADFAMIAKEMAERWKALDPDSKNHYREQFRVETERYHRDVRLIKEHRGQSRSTPLAKGPMTGASLDRYIAPLTPLIVKNREKLIKQQPVAASRPWLQHSKDITCSLDIIKKRLKKSHSQETCSGTMSVLGRVTASGGWVCVQGSSIMALNVYRLQENVLYNTLLKTFSVSVKLLDDPLPFNASTVGMESWATLLKLPRELVPDRNLYYVTDQRLTDNGFKVALFPGATDGVIISYGEVTHMTDSVGYYGITDLKEVLSILATSPQTSLKFVRPLKLQHWLKAEAVRMVRSGPNLLRKEDVLEQLNKWHQILADDEGGNQPPYKEKCIHDRPVYAQLYCLEDLPSSQAQTS